MHEDTLRTSARSVLDQQWREPGFTCPNASTYPWLWLWDSCFHSIVWAELGDGDRAVLELSTALAGQDADGFVPHLAYLDGSGTHDAFWGRPSTSSITQPPIYGHTVSELTRRGVQVPGGVLDRATAGLRFLLERRRRSPNGMVELVHPWESGCDHSPRWDDLIVTEADRAPGGGVVYDESVWFRRKGELLGDIHRSSTGAPLWSDAFAIGSVAFTAMVAFCASELASVTGDRWLLDESAGLSAALADRWDPGRRTWIDDGPTAHGSGRVRTVEALLPLLVETRPDVIDDVVAELADRQAFGGEFGPAQVHRDEPTHLAGSYWRGPSWPQLDYLLWVALDRSGRSAAADELASATVRGAIESGWAEYWGPDDGRPGGAAPQSWATLAVCLPRAVS